MFSAFNWNQYIRNLLPAATWLRNIFHRCYTGSRLSSVQYVISNRRLTLLNSIGLPYIK